MRKLLAILWLMIPIGMVAYHFGPGQPMLARDRAAKQIAEARAAESRKDWSVAQAAYRQALSDLPEADVDARLATRLALAKTRPQLGELPEAMADAEAILDDAIRDSKDAALQDEIRSAAGQMHYHVAWLMRLEGAEADEWTEQTEAARQHFRLLSEESKADARDGHEKNLEATIRLAQMDLSELKGLPLPSQCKNSGNCSGKCRSQKQGRKKPPGEGSSDAREKIQEQKTKSAGNGGNPGGGS